MTLLITITSLLALTVYLVGALASWTALLAMHLAGIPMHARPAFKMAMLWPVYFVKRVVK